MKDLFEREEQILTAANAYLESVVEEGCCSPVEFAKLIREYKRILKLIRRVTKVSDKTTVELNDEKMDLLDKVRFDSLTGIFNRRYFDENVRYLLKQCIEGQLSFSVLMLDVDFFKQYNDTYGHGMGDECLKQIAKAIECAVEEENGFAARYGGEEFIVVLQGNTSDEVRGVAERIRKNVENLKIPHEKSQTSNNVTISIGAVLQKHVFVMNELEYVKNADKALYQAKRNGRNQVTFHEFKEEKK